MFKSNKVYRYMQPQGQSPTSKNPRGGTVRERIILKWRK
jgi:hypothetical protein